MIEELKIEGVWWLPERQDLKLPGTLTFSPHEGFSLEVQGSFEDIAEIKKIRDTKIGKIRDIVESSRQDIILGLSHQGKDITLYKCFMLSYEFNTSGFARLTFSAALSKKPLSVKIDNHE